MKRTFIFISTLLLILALGGCSTVPAYKPSFPQVTIDRAVPSDIESYGFTFETNPYKEPATLVRGKLNEFFIAKISFNLPKASRVHIIAEMKTPDGKSAAQAMTSEDFKSFWYVNTSTNPNNDAKIQMRITNIERSCVPSLVFEQEKGQTSLFLPFVGPNPIPRPATVYIQVSTGQGEPAVYTFTLN